MQETLSSTPVIHSRYRTFCRNQPSTDRFACWKSCTRSFLQKQDQIGQGQVPSQEACLRTPQLLRIKGVTDATGSYRHILLFREIARTSGLSNVLHLDSDAARMQCRAACKAGRSATAALNARPTVVPFVANHHLADFLSQQTCVFHAHLPFVRHRP